MVAAGGDGTYSELCNGLLKRTAKDSGIDIDDPEQEVLPPTIPLGLLPTGSGSVTLSSAHRTLDVVTATVAIIRGDTIPKDLGLVRCEGKFISYILVLSAAGFFLNFGKITEKFRWFGPIRYILVAMFLKRYLVQTVEAEIDFLPVNKDECDQGHQKVIGSFSHIECFPLDVNIRTTRCALAKGSMLMYLMKDGLPYGQSMKTYWSYWQGAPTAYDDDHVIHSDVSWMRVRYTGDWATKPEALEAMIDGEMFKLTKPVYDIRLHRGLVKVYGRDLF